MEDEEAAKLEVGVDKVASPEIPIASDLGEDGDVCEDMAALVEASGEISIELAKELVSDVVVPVSDVASGDDTEAFEEAKATARSRGEAGSRMLVYFWLGSITMEGAGGATISAGVLGDSASGDVARNRGSSKYSE